MPGQRRLSIVVLLVMIAATLPATEAQDNQSRLAVGKGQGTLKVGEERFKINSVIVKLIDDRKAEITLVSDITVFLNATWSNHGESQEEFDLDITGGSNAGAMDGTGKVFLSTDGKMVTRLSLKGTSRTTKRTVEVTFAGE